MFVTKGFSFGAVQVKLDAIGGCPGAGNNRTWGTAGQRQGSLKIIEIPGVLEILGYIFHLKVIEKDVNVLLWVH